MVFDTIAKWWCQCIDQLFHLVARPWKEEELPYRRMIHGVFETPWTLPRAWDEFLEWNKDQQLVGWGSTRSRLQEFTRFYWERNSYQMTPSWPTGATVLLEEIFVDQLETPDRFDKTTVMAIRMLYGLGCERLQKHLIPKTLGVSARPLYEDMWKTEHYYKCCLRHHPHLHLFREARYQSELDRYFFAWQDKKKAEQETREKAERRLQRQADIERLLQELPQELLDMTIEDNDLEWSVRAYNALFDNQCKTVRAILETSEKTMITWPRGGRKTINHINEALKQLDPRLSVGCLVLDQ